MELREKSLKIFPAHLRQKVSTNNNINNNTVLIFIDSDFFFSLIFQIDDLYAKSVHYYVLEALIRFNGGDSAALLPSTAWESYYFYLTLQNNLLIIS